MLISIIELALRNYIYSCKKDLVLPEQVWVDFRRPGDTAYTEADNFSGYFIDGLALDFREIPDIVRAESKYDSTKYLALGLAIKQKLNYKKIPPQLLQYLLCHWHQGGLFSFHMPIMLLLQSEKNLKISLNFGRLRKEVSSSSEKPNQIIVKTILEINGYSFLDTASNPIIFDHPLYLQYSVTIAYEKNKEYLMFLEYSIFHKEESLETELKNKKKLIQILNNFLSKKIDPHYWIMLSSNDIKNLPSFAKIKIDGIKKLPLLSLDAKEAEKFINEEIEAKFSSESINPYISFFQAEERPANFRKTLLTTLAINLESLFDPEAVFVDAARMDFYMDEQKLNFSNLPLEVYAIDAYRHIGPIWASAAKHKVGVELLTFLMSTAHQGGLAGGFLIPLINVFQREKNIPIFGKKRLNIFSTLNEPNKIKLEYIALLSGVRKECVDGTVCKNFFSSPIVINFYLELIYSLKECSYSIALRNIKVKTDAEEEHAIKTEQFIKELLQSEIVTKESSKNSLVEIYSTEGREWVLSFGKRATETLLRTIQTKTGLQNFNPYILGADLFYSMPQPIEFPSNDRWLESIQKKYVSSFHQKLISKDKSLWKLIFSSSSQYLATFHTNNNIHLWTVNSGSWMQNSSFCLDSVHGRIVDAVFTPDEKCLIIAVCLSSQTNIFTYDLTLKQKQFRFPVHPAGIFKNMTYLQDGTLLICFNDGIGIVIQPFSLMLFSSKLQNAAQVSSLLKLEENEVKRNITLTLKVDTQTKDHFAELNLVRYNELTKDLEKFARTRIRFNTQWVSELYISPGEKFIVFWTLDGTLSLINIMNLISTDYPPPTIDISPYSVSTQPVTPLMNTISPPPLLPRLMNIPANDQMMVRFSDKYYLIDGHSIATIPLENQKSAVIIKSTSRPEVSLKIGHYSAQAADQYGFFYHSLDDSHAREKKFFVQELEYTLADYKEFSAYFSPYLILSGNAGFTILQKINDVEFRPLWNSPIAILKGVISSNGQSMIGVDKNGFVHTLNMQTRNIEGTFKLLLNDIITEHGITFSPDASEIVLGGSREFLKRWDIKTGQLLNTYSRSWMTVRCEYSPDGKYIASLNEDGFIQVWNVLTDEPFLSHQFLEHYFVIDFFFIENGTKLRVETGKQVQIFNINLEKLI